ncbi:MULTISPECIES: NUDIX domain-containing protein [Candidatus Ichthyocystis]|uniref:NUDIX domain-containing protein n=1 Tax=Candidatus Ichthyocystis TaxID=2929841 RepID=UPI000A7D1D18|nr:MULTISPECIES: NUDIX hydrolase [Ichthyocystis]
MNKDCEPPLYNFSNEDCSGDEYLVETVCDSRSLVTIGPLSLEEDIVALYDGSLSSRRYMRHPGAVVIIACRGDAYLFVRQYRCACKQIFWEFPAGKIDKGEDPLDAAKREFREEGGYEAGYWKSMGLFYPCIGYSSEKMYLYYAKDLNYLGQDTDEGEVINCFFIGCSDLRNMINKGAITDSKTLSALSLLAAQGMFSLT